MWTESMKIHLWNDTMSLLLECLSLIIKANAGGGGGGGGQAKIACGVKLV